MGLAGCPGERSEAGRRRTQGSAAHVAIQGGDRDYRSLRRQAHASTVVPLVCCPKDAWTVHDNPTLPDQANGARFNGFCDHPTLLRDVDVPAVACRKSQSAAGPTVVVRGSGPGRCHWCEVRFEPGQTRASRVDVGQDGAFVQPEACGSWDAVPDGLARGGSVHPWNRDQSAGTERRSADWSPQPRRRNA
jgi:hypothetical protein